MNNTSRLSTYSIIAILLFFVVGIVWFYFSKEHSIDMNVTKKQSELAKGSAIKNPETAGFKTQDIVAGNPEKYKTLKHVSENGAADALTQAVLIFDLDDDQYEDLKKLTLATLAMGRDLVAQSSLVTVNANDTLTITSQRTREIIEPIEKEILKNIYTVVGEEAWKAKMSDALHADFINSFLLLREGRFITTVDNISQVANGGGGVMKFIFISKSGNKTSDYTSINNLDDFGPVMKNKIISAKKNKTP